MFRKFIWAHNPGSKGAKALADGLGIRIIKHEGSKYRQRNDDVIINWGASRPPYRLQLNLDYCVAVASNKLTCFNALKEANVSIPEFTADKEIARGWGGTVVCRTILNGHSGAGIVICEDAVVNLVDAPLYVKYVPKKEETRVHVAFGKVYCSST